MVSSCAAFRCSMPLNSSPQSRHTCLGISPTACQLRSASHWIQWGFLDSNFYSDPAGLFSRSSPSSFDFWFWVQHPDLEVEILTRPSLTVLSSSRPWSFDDIKEINQHWTKLCPSSFHDQYSSSKKASEICHSLSVGGVLVVPEEKW